MITRRLLGRAWLLTGSVSAVLALAVYFAVLYRAGWQPGDAVASGTPLHHAYPQATTATFAAIVACQIRLRLPHRVSLAARDRLFRNPLLLAGIAAEVSLVAALAYAPPLQDMLGTAALPARGLLLLLPCPVLVWGADETYRQVLSTREARH
jgi:hypothetical protein